MSIIYGQEEVLSCDGNQAVDPGFGPGVCVIDCRFRLIDGVPVRLGIERKDCNVWKRNKGSHTVHFGNAV